MLLMAETRTIQVGYEIELPDDVGAVGGMLLADNDDGAIANIEHIDGSRSAWLMNPRDRKWRPSRNGDWFYEGDRAYVVVRGVREKEAVSG
jgi:hypothetical protein